MTVYIQGVTSSQTVNYLTIIASLCTQIRFRLVQL